MARLCQMLCFLISCVEFEKAWSPEGLPPCVLFLRTLLPLKTPGGCLAQARASGWQ